MTAALMDALTFMTPSATGLRWNERDAEFHGCAGGGAREEGDVAAVALQDALDDVQAKAGAVCGS